MFSNEVGHKKGQSMTQTEIEQYKQKIEHMVERLNEITTNMVEAGYSDDPIYEGEYVAVDLDDSDVEDWITVLEEVKKDANSLVEDLQYTL